MADEIKLRSYLATVLTDAQPPDNPIVGAGWAGIAFDRNLHEDLAPTDVWEAWLGVHRDMVGPDAVLFVESLVSVDQAAARGAILLPNMESLRRYWMDDAKFLRDHYVISQKSGFVIRLDQDVTLFAANAGFLSKVIERLSGLGSVMSRMVDDFYPGEGDPIGLQHFLDEIVAPLIR